MIEFIIILTLNLLTTTIVAPPSNASKWQMGFNSSFKGLIIITSLEMKNLVSGVHHQQTLCSII
jgi:hypothetical protein